MRKEEGMCHTSSIATWKMGTRYLNWKIPMKMWRKPASEMFHF